VAQAIAEQTGWRLLVCGGHADVDMAQNIVDLAELNNSLSLAGETSISELAEVIRGAQLLVGNETSAVHIAAAVGTPSVCLLGGGHFGRFVPYPEGIEGAAPIPVFQRMECYGCNWRCTQPHEPGQPTPCITAIPAADVIAAVQKILPKREPNAIEAH
jgi:ADP-heptose:LPS heptosyltransferase